MHNYSEIQSTWDKLAPAYEEKFMHLDIYHKTYDRFAELLPKVSQVLELGCGPGMIGAYLLSKHPTFQFLGTDVSPSMIEHARKNVPLAQFQTLDCRNIRSLQSKFNGIIAGFVIPYLTKIDCRRFILECSEMMEEQGVLYLSYVSGVENESGMQTNSQGDSMYFQYYSDSSIQQMLEEAQLNDVEIFKIPYFNQQVHTCLIAQKKSV
jgi:cyclopropane fatty-acyl-phospholipid synthase-like methyltransferase